MTSQGVSDVSDSKGNDIVPVAVDVRSADQEEHRQRILGLTLPRYFNKDEDRRLVRKLDTFLMCVPFSREFYNAREPSNFSTGPILRCHASCRH